MPRPKRTDPEADATRIDGWTVRRAGDTLVCTNPALPRGYVKVAGEPGIDHDALLAAARRAIAQAADAADKE